MQTFRNLLKLVDTVDPNDWNVYDNGHRYVTIFPCDDLNLNIGQFTKDDGTEVTEFRFRRINVESTGEYVSVMLLSFHREGEVYLCNISPGFDLPAENAQTSVDTPIEDYVPATIPSEAWELTSNWLKNIQEVRV